MASPSRTQTDVSEVLETALEEALLQNRIVGGAYAVVGPEGLQSSFNLGALGFADREAERPASATHTPFRSCSASKLFTAVCLLRLVDDGLLSLDDQVASILPFVAKGMTHSHVAVRDLLNHQAGFEEKFYGSLVTSQQYRPLDDAARRKWVHRQVRPAGEAVVYSNYAMALAGEVIAALTQKPYHQAVQSLLFTPLGMMSAIPEAPDPRFSLCAKEYELGPGSRATRMGDYHKHPFFHGSGGFYYTMEDAGKFVAFLLACFRGDGGGLLSGSTGRSLFVRQASNVAGTGIGHGLWHYLRADHDDGGPEGCILCGHGGVTESTRTQFMMAPHLGIGVYVATNGTPRDARSKELALQPLCERALLGPPPPSTTTAPSPPKNAKTQRGWLLSGRRTDQGWEGHLNSLLSVGFSHATHRAGDTVSFEGNRYHRDADGAWRTAGGMSGRLSLTETDEGRTRFKTLNKLGEPVALWRHPAFAISLFFLSTFASLGSLGFYALAGTPVPLVSLAAPLALLIAFFYPIACLFVLKAPFRIRNRALDVTPFVLVGALSATAAAFVIPGAWVSDTFSALAASGLAASFTGVLSGGGKRKR